MFKNLKQNKVSIKVSFEVLHNIYSAAIYVFLNKWKRCKVPIWMSNAKSRDLFLKEHQTRSRTADKCLLLSLSCSLSHFSSLYTTAAFGSVNMCMWDIDLNPVCGMSEPWALVVQCRFRYSESEVIQLLLWYTEGRFLVEICVVYVCSYSQCLKHTQRGDSQTLSGDQTLQGGLGFTISPYVLSEL